MARRRERPSRASNAQDSQTASQSNTTEREVSYTMSALSPDMINELLSKARVKGSGDEVLKDFLESEEAGIEVSLTDGPFAGKSAQQAFTTLNNTKSKVHKDGELQGELVYPSAKQVVVVKRKGEDGVEHVFLINKAKIGA